MYKKILLSEWQRRKRPASGFRFIICSIKQLRDAKNIDYQRVNSRLYQLIAANGNKVHAVIVNRSSHTLKPTSSRKKRKSKSSRKESLSPKSDLRNTNLVDEKPAISANKNSQMSARIRTRPNKVRVSTRHRTRIMHYEEESQLKFTESYRIRNNNSSHIDKDTFNHPGEGTPASILA